MTGRETVVTQFRADMCWPGERMFLRATLAVVYLTIQPLEVSTFLNDTDDNISVCVEPW